MPDTDCFVIRELPSSDEGEEFEGFDDYDDSDGDEQREEEDIASEPSSEDEETSAERPYNSLLQLLNTGSDRSHARKRRKLDHSADESRNDDSYEVNMEVDEQDFLQNQEASEEEDTAEEERAESDDDDEDGQ